MSKFKNGDDIFVRDIEQAHFYIKRGLSPKKVFYSAYNDSIVYVFKYEDQRLLYWEYVEWKKEERDTLGDDLFEKCEQ